MFIHVHEAFWRIRAIASVFIGENAQVDANL